MQSYTTLDSIGYGSELASGGQYAPNQFVSVPTQNRFAPLHEWVGYSMGVEEPGPEQMELQWVPVRNKRTGDSIQGVRMQVLVKLTFLH